MEVIKCDICEKYYEDTPLEAVLIVKRKPYLHYPDSHGGRADLCKRCWNKFEKVWEEFTGWKPHDWKIDWDDDGSTMATDSWGGAGPDCHIVQE